MGSVSVIFQKLWSPLDSYFRVMDHDTYSANDAIGRVNLDCNVLVERMRVTKIDSCEETMIMKIYDTLYGNKIISRAVYLACTAFEQLCSATALQACNKVVLSCKGLGSSYKN